MNSNKLTENLLAFMNSLFEHHKTAVGLGTFYGLLMDLTRNVYTVWIKSKIGIDLSTVPTLGWILIGIGLCLPVSLLYKAFRTDRAPLQKVVFYIKKLKEFGIMSDTEIRHMSRELIRNEMDQEAIDKAYQQLENKMLQAGESEAD